MTLEPDPYTRVWPDKSHIITSLRGKNRVHKIYEKRILNTFQAFFIIFFPKFKLYLKLMLDIKNKVHICRFGLV